MADAQVGRSDYELERDRRVAENKRKMQELGVVDAAAVLATSKPAKRPKKVTVFAPADSSDRRISARERKAVNYCELETRSAREAKAPVDHTERIKEITLDQETAEQLRKDLEEKKGSSKSGGKARGPVDSGKGVRVQGGRVYDSAHGVTCHWCRQKTLEEHVTCTNPDCGRGRRMPLSFCSKCLKNRHGEDCVAAADSDCWWCPSCRGSCGPGCVACCNCGFCRKKAGLEPTHQVVRLARDAGFDNVHDYLVHLVTGETAEQIAARKLQFPWGSWLKPSGASTTTTIAAAAAGGGRGDSDVSEQTGEDCQPGCLSKGCSAEGSMDEDDNTDGAAERDQGCPAVALGKEAAARTSQAPGKPPARNSRAGGKRGKAAAAAAAGVADAPGSTHTSSGKRGKAVAAAGSGASKRGRRAGERKASALQAVAEDEAAEGQAEDQAEDQEVVPQQPEHESQHECEAEEDPDVPLLSSQDMRLPRKLRIMQQLGLAPVTVVTK